ncbi:hypothetical protein AAVH_26932 [Aphelenchoides avenae]|nr:hypothetical protein AAVH_26932 [Aphelenchus avenae]
MAEFIAEAFRNCTVDLFELATRRELILPAIKAVANTITVAHLNVKDQFIDRAQELPAFVESFRRVEV